MLVLLGLAVLVWMVDPNGFKPRIEATVREATGRDFTLVGDIELGFFPWLSLRTGSGKFGNPPGFAGEPMASWQRAQLGARLFPLLRGELVVDRVRLEGADIRLTRRADGSANWQGIGAEAPAAADTPRRHITIDGVDIKDSRVLFVDEGAGQRIELTALNLTTDAIDPARPFTDTEIEGRLHMPGFAPEGVRVQARGARGRAHRGLFPARGGEILGAAGRARSQRCGQGQPWRGHAADGPLRNEYLRRARTAGDRWASRLRRPPIRPRSRGSASRLTGNSTPARWLPIRSRCKLDDTHFTGSFQRGAGDDPVGAFELRGDQLDLARYIPATDPASPPFVLPTAALRALKFRGVLQLEQAKYEDVAMKGVTLRLLLDEQGMRSQTPPGKGAP